MHMVASTHCKSPRTRADKWNAKYNAATYDYFDWYLGCTELHPHLQDVLDRYDSSCEIFIPGCGMSELAFHLYDIGYENITNADISPAAIERMSREQDRRHATGIQCVVVDATHMPDVPNQCFDVIIDKGLLDTILCGSNNIEDALALMHELHRVLKINGTLVLISHGAPDTRLMYLARETLDWTVHSSRTIERECFDDNKAAPSSTKMYYMYTCHRQPL